MKIGIIGQGILGKTHKHYLLKNTNHETFTYDINGDCNSTMEIISKHCRIVFVCVPTDTGKDGRLDMSIVEKISKQLNDLGYTGACIFRSTLRVGTTRKMAKKYPGIDFYFIPEFLTERFAREDFENPHRKLALGYVNIENAYSLYMTLKNRGIVKGLHGIVRAEEAEMLKIATNSFYAMKVIFANELSLVCKQSDISYENIKTLLAEDYRIGSSEEDLSGEDVHLRIAQDGKPGYGGKCLPKDSLEFVKMAEEIGIKRGLLEKVVEINNVIRNCVKTVDK